MHRHPAGEPDRRVVELRGLPAARAGIAVAMSGAMLVAILFLLVVLGVAAAIVRLVPPAARARVALGIAGWLAITGVIAGSGLVAFDGGPPRIMALPILAIVIGLVAYRRTFAAIPQQHIIGLQVFRIAVELVLWALFLDGIIPIQMTFEGRNFDVLVGLTAIPVAVLAAARPRLALGWHVLGFGLLLNIVITAVLSTPGPLRVFTNEPANTIIATFPYVWLPAFLVPVALLSHLAGIRRAVISPR